MVGSLCFLKAVVTHPTFNQTLNYMVIMSGFPFTYMTRGNLPVIGPGLGVCGYYIGLCSYTIECVLWLSVTLVRGYVSTCV